MTDANAGAGEPQTRVVVADDHTLFRDGLRELLETDPGCAVVGEAATSDEALALVAHLHPDVLLLDVEMPGPGTAVVIDRVRRDFPRTRVIVLTMHESAAIVQDLLARGAYAFLVKNIAAEELIAAVHSVGRGRNNVLLSVSRETIGDLESHRETAPALVSQRELDVLRLVAQAYSNGQIASRLGITEGTVKRHLTNAYAKLDAVSRVDAIRKAVAARLLSPEETA
ncbi:response regulator transcription factor [Micromonospora rubida]|uniref:response regulator transcription factor n=1 Tax=Micromonospora rubida TaxID=2697657 RepID=UPI002E28347A|nr:response regulator transcription factor [Micromonospora rubida]